MAARPHRLPDRRRRIARTLVDRLDAQPGADDRGVVPDQGSADPLQDGERWFWDTLVDADLASNAASWQWVAGCGADAAPYFRVFNPSLQGVKFDPDGDYVRRWVPELARLPAAAIHTPWEARPLDLADAGIRLGHDYPRPIVDHKAARERALTLFHGLSESGGQGE